MGPHLAERIVSSCATAGALMPASAGAGSQEAGDYSDFAAAILQKLLREIGADPVVTGIERHRRPG